MQCSIRNCRARNCHLYARFLAAPSTATMNVNVPSGARASNDSATPQGIDVYVHMSDREQLEALASILAQQQVDIGVDPQNAARRAVETTNAMEKNRLAANKEAVQARREQYSNIVNPTQDRSASCDVPASNVILASSDHEGDDVDHEALKRALEGAILKSESGAHTRLRVGDFATVDPSLAMLDRLSMQKPCADVAIVLGNRDLNQWRWMLMLDAYKLLAPSYCEADVPEGMYKAMTWLVADVGSAINLEDKCPKFVEFETSKTKVDWVQAVQLFEAAVQAVKVPEYQCSPFVRERGPLHALAVFAICYTMMGSTTQLYTGPRSTVWALALGNGGAINSSNRAFSELRVKSNSDLAILEEQFKKMAQLFAPFKPNAKEPDRPRPTPEQLKDLLQAFDKCGVALSFYFKYWTALSGMYKTIFGHKRACLMYFNPAAKCASVHAGLRVPYRLLDSTAPIRYTGTKPVPALDARGVAMHESYTDGLSYYERVNEQYYQLAAQALAGGATKMNEAANAYVALAALSGVPTIAKLRADGAGDTIAVVDSNGPASGQQFPAYPLGGQKLSPFYIDEFNSASTYGPWQFLFTGHQPAQFGEIIRHVPTDSRPFNASYNIRLDTQYQQHSINVCMAVQGSSMDAKLRSTARNNQMTRISLAKRDAAIKKKIEELSYKLQIQSKGSEWIQYQLKGLIRRGSSTYRVVVFRPTSIYFETFAIKVDGPFGHSMAEHLCTHTRSYPVVFNSAYVKHELVGEGDELIKIKLVEDAVWNAVAPARRDSLRQEAADAVEAWMEGDSATCGVLPTDDEYSMLTFASPLRDMIVGSNNLIHAV